MKPKPFTLAPNYFRALAAGTFLCLGLANVAAGCGDDEGGAPAATNDCNRRCQDQNGPHWVCRPSDRQCVSLVSAECPNVIGDDTKDEAVVFGMLVPNTGPSSAIGKSLGNGYRLALEELSAGLPPAPGSTARRPLVVVECDDAGNVDREVAATAHLIDNVGVPAIFGPVFSGFAVKIATEWAVPKGVVLMSASASTDALTGLPDNDMVWRTLPPDSNGVDAFIALGQRVEAQLDAQGVSPMKIFVAHKGDSLGTNLANGLEARYSFNDLAANDPANADNFERFNYGNPQDPMNNPPRYAEVADAILRERPHVVFQFGTTEMVTEVVKRVEEGWRTLEPAPPHRPIYLLSAGAFDPATSSIVGNDNELRTRITAVLAGNITPLYTGFASKFNARFANEGTLANAFLAGAYDAVYAYAYAAAAAGGKPLTGALMAAGLRKLVGGPTVVDAGPAGFEDAANALAAGQTIDFNGASGPLDFNAAGEPQSDYQLGCVVRDASGYATGVTLSGEFYNAAEAKITGTRSADCN